MFQIIYKSENKINSENLNEEIKNILDSSKRNNGKSGISGIFLLVQNRFIQLLEGDEREVNACMERIKIDPRHSDVKVILSRNVENRTFPEWSMYFHKLLDEEAIEKLGVDSLKNLGISKWESHYKDDLAVLLIESFARLASR
jgi:hypothetical protein